MQIALIFACNKIDKFYWAIEKKYLEMRKLALYICIVKQKQIDKNKEMTTIIGYTDSITQCECCGKVDLKGTYCLDIDGVELYYGSVCAFKNHGITTEEQKDAKAAFNKEQKNKKLYDLHIAPLKKELAERLENSFTTNYANLTDVAKKVYHDIELNYTKCIELRAKKYKISL